MGISDNGYNQEPKVLFLEKEGDLEGSILNTEVLACVVYAKSKATTLNREGRKGVLHTWSKPESLRISFLLSSTLTFSTLRRCLTWQHLLPISFPPRVWLQTVVSSYSTCRNWLFIPQLSGTPCRPLMKRDGVRVYITGSHPFFPGEWSSLKGRGLKYQRSGREEERILLAEIWVKS